MLDRLKCIDGFNWNYLGFGLAQLAYIEMYKLLMSHYPASRLILDVYWGSAALAAALVGFVALSGISILRLRSLTIIIALAQTILGALAFATGFFAEAPATTFAYAILLGAGCSLLWIAWEDKLAELGSASIVFYVAACAFVMAFFHVASTLVPSVHAPLVLCAQLGAFVLLLSGFEAGAWERNPGRPLDSKGALVIDAPLSPRSLMVVTFVFVFSYHFATKTVYSETTDAFKDAEDIVSACIMFGIFFFATRCRLAKILQVSLPLIILSYLLVQLLPESSRSACIIVSGSASKLVQLVLIAETIYAAGTRSGRGRWKILSFNVAALFLGRLMSDLCVEGIDMLSPVLNPDASAMYVLLAVLLLALLALLNVHPREERRRAGALDENESLASAFERAIDEVASEHRLTAREADVLGLLAQGRTQAVIAEKLCISKGTAHAHISHIYHKMDVHSQQDLIDLMEEVIAGQ